MKLQLAKHFGDWYKQAVYSCGIAVQLRCERKPIKKSSHKYNYAIVNITTYCIWHAGLYERPGISKIDSRI